MRDRLMVPDVPALAPLVKAYWIRADEQLRNVTVAVPTSTVAGGGFVTRSTNPPVVSYSFAATVRLPAT